MTASPRSDVLSLAWQDAEELKAYVYAQHQVSLMSEQLTALEEMAPFADIVFTAFPASPRAGRTPR